MQLMTPDEVAEYTRLTAAALCSFRKRGFGGPTYVKLGGRYFYHKADVDDWIAANTHPQPPAEIKEKKLRSILSIKSMTGRKGRSKS